MIEKMKKITFLVSEKEREKFVSGLREAGVLHIKHVREPEDHDIRFVEDRISKIDRIASVLALFDEEGVSSDGKCDEREILEAEQKISEEYAEREQLLNDLRELREKLEWYKVWGDFDPEDLRLLGEKGASIKLYRINAKSFKGISRNIKAQVLRRSGGYVYAAVLGAISEEEAEAEEILPPGDSPEKIKKTIEEKKKKIEEIEASLRKKARGIAAILKCREDLEKELEFLRVKYGMQGEGKFAYLQGFCPIKKMDKISKLAEANGAGYLTEDVEEDDETPTLITNPAWIRIVAPVFNFMSTVPGYNEFDISFVFMIFFSLFFAMLIGDAGYGIVFLVITFLARTKFRKAPYEPFFLMYLLGGATLVWGALTGTWFGSETIAQLPGLKSLVIGKIDSFGADNQNFMIFICFVIGAIHLTIARLLRFVRFINSPKAAAEAGWIAIIWGMFFAAGKLVLSRPFPGAAGYLLLGGILTVLVFANFQKNVIKGMLTTLTSLPLNVIGAFSDVVSYLRLFAVGYASVVLASTFNNMAIGDGISGVVSGIIAAFILFFGHLLNILLGMMAVVVHGIRLNMLEFSGHLGMQWSGKKYEPFREK